MCLCVCVCVCVREGCQSEGSVKGKFCMEVGGCEMKEKF